MPINTDELLSRVDLADLAGRAEAKLKPTGKGYRGNCPLHGGDNPTSFAILESPDGRDRWFCFSGCTPAPGHKWANGDAIEFVKRWKGLDFLDAVRELAAIAGVSLEDLGITPEGAKQVEEARQQRERQRGILEVAADYYRDLLKDEPGARARTYAEARGWSAETISELGLGYADGHLLDHLRSSPEGTCGLDADLELAGEVGLVYQSDDGRLRDAIPGGYLVYVHRRAGTVEYLTGRSVTSDDPRYKSRNLHSPKQPYWLIRNYSRPLIVVEGQADAITAWQWEYNAVALCGSDLDEERAAAMRRFKAIYLALDSDQAGRQRIATVADQLGSLTRILALPEVAGDSEDVGYKDLNEWSTRGNAIADDLQKMMDAAPTWLQFAADRIRPTGDGDDLRHFFAQVARLDPFEIAWQRDDLARRLGIGVRQFDRMLKAHGVELEDDEDRGILKEITTPGGYAAEHLFEMLVTHDDPPRSVFAVRYPDGEVGVVPILEIEGIRYRPIPADDDLISKNVVLFPAELGDHTDECELQAGIQRFIHRYLDIDPFYEKMASYYVMFTWLYDCFNTLPYLRALGDYGTGKTRFLQVVGSLCYRPMFLGGASTTSPIFRIIDLMRGTLVLDEADFQASDAEADIIKILNTGYMKGFPVLRTEKDGGDSFVVIALDVYGPKVIATRRRYQDRALESRMLTKEMTSVLRDDVPLLLPREFWGEAQSLRDRLVRYRLQTWQPDIEVDLNELDRSIEPRLNQVTLSLKTVIQDGGLRADITGFIREYNRQLVADRGMTLAATVLSVIVALREQPITSQLDGTPEYDLSLKTITRKVNEFLTGEREDGEGDDPVNSKKVGYEIRERLQLGTEKKSGYYSVVWDEERIQALRRRFGV